MLFFFFVSLSFQLLQVYELVILLINNLIFYLLFVFIFLMI